MMLNKTRLISLFIFFTALSVNTSFSGKADEIVIDDFNYRFTIRVPDGWDKKDMKETKDKDGISYSLEKKDKKMTIMLLAFKLSSVKNIDDFIYNMEKDISLNIPSKSGSYNEKDHGTYDEKSAVYKDNNFAEVIYYFRTKLPDAPNNYVYMVRFITKAIDSNNDTETLIKGIAETFKSTAE
jgi:hypothetical protein